MGKRASMLDFGRVVGITDVERFRFSISKQWQHAGLECAAVSTPANRSEPRHSGTHNGYVRIDAGDVEAFRDIRTDRVDVHGGVNWFGHVPWADGMWVGFDTLGWDNDPTTWNLAAVVRETERMARQIRRLLTPPDQLGTLCRTDDLAETLFGD